MLGGKSVYYVQEHVTVNNYYIDKTPNDDLLIWGRTLGAISSDSIMIFDKNKNIAYMNDRFGTFSNHNVSCVRDVITILSNTYTDTGMASKKIVEIFSWKAPIIFDLRHRRCGYNVTFRAMPVLSRFGELKGVVFAASRDNVIGNGRPRISIENSKCEKP